ncbi:MULTISPECIES: hypothetical protein [Cyanophyceae]|nr:MULTISPECIES: hypothetical protein [unclassified Trichocoleus]
MLKEFVYAIAFCRQFSKSDLTRLPVGNDSGVKSLARSRSGYYYI